MDFYIISAECGGYRLISHGFEIEDITLEQILKKYERLREKLCEMEMKTDLCELQNDRLFN